MNWDKITDIILFASIALLGVFALLGLYQWITRKSLKKVDRNLLAFFVPLILMVITYLIFDKLFILNTRPDGSGEPSFPSSHAMAVTTIFMLIALNLPTYIRQKPLRVVLYILMFALTILVAIGRVLADKHWASDVLAGLVFAGIFILVYYLIIRRTKNVQHLH